MNRIYCVFIMLITTVAMKAQTTATDFTATTCGIGSGSKNLFTELNNGKIIVIAWVMPCIGCIDGAKAADSAVKNFNLSHPGVASLWLVDDGPPSDCSVMTAWAASQQMSKPTVFGNYNNEIDQANYGGNGMPHIVVIAPDKKIHFNQLDGTGNGVAAAINAAYMATGIDRIQETVSFTVAPNPVTSSVKLSSKSSLRQIQIRNIKGQILKTINLNNTTDVMLSMAELSPGDYILFVTDKNDNTGSVKIVKQ